jgi:hypothetical protein
MVCNFAFVHLHFGRGEIKLLMHVNPSRVGNRSKTKLIFKSWRNGGQLILILRTFQWIGEVGSRY